MQINSKSLIIFSMKIQIKIKMIYFNKEINNKKNKNTKNNKY